MSKDAMVAFVKRVTDDKAFGARLEAALEGTEGDAAMQRDDGFARDAGFEVEAGDIVRLQAPAHTAGDDLDDHQLDAVACGTDPFTFIANDVKSVFSDPIGFFKERARYL